MQKKKKKPTKFEELEQPLEPDSDMAETYQIKNF